MKMEALFCGVNFDDVRLYASNRMEKMGIRLVEGVNFRGVYWRMCNLTQTEKQSTGSCPSFHSPSQTITNQNIDVTYLIVSWQKRDVMGEQEELV